MKKKQRAKAKPINVLVYVSGGLIQGASVLAKDAHAVNLHIFDEDELKDGRGLGWRAREELHKRWAHEVLGDGKWTDAAQDYAHSGYCDCATPAPQDGILYDGFQKCQTCGLFILESFVVVEGTRGVCITKPK